MSPLPDTEPRLAIRDLHKSFDERVVLDGVDLDVTAGSVVLLAGTNGSGKTTLLRCAAGLAAHVGEVRVDGRPWRGTVADRRLIGYLPQALGLPEWATVSEVLALFAELRGAAVDEMDVPASFLPPSDQRIGSLSGGQRQRVAICVALLGHPRVLLLDEPAANLDEDGRDDLFTVLEAARNRGTSVLVAAPSPVDLNGLPDRTVRLRDGRIGDVEAGPRSTTSRAPAPDASPVDRLGPATSMPLSAGSQEVAS